MDKTAHLIEHAQDVALRRRKVDLSPSRAIKERDRVTQLKNQWICVPRAAGKAHHAVASRKRKDLGAAVPGLAESKPAVRRKDELLSRADVSDPGDGERHDDHYC